MVRGRGWRVGVVLTPRCCAERQGREGGGVACWIAWVGEGLGLLHNPRDIGSGGGGPGEWHAGSLNHNKRGIANKQGHSLCPRLLH